MSHVSLVFRWAAFCTLIAMPFGGSIGQDTNDAAKPSSETAPSLELREDMQVFARLVTNAAREFDRESRDVERRQSCQRCHTGGDLLIGSGFDADYHASANDKNSAWVFGSSGSHLSKAEDDRISFRATYVPTVGVVIHGSMPAPVERITVASASESEPRDPWEKARRELRGLPEKSEDWSVVTLRNEPSHPKLIEALKSVVQKQGARIRGLSPGERITIAITFTPAAEPPRFIDLHGALDSDGQIRFYPLIGRASQELRNGELRLHLFDEKLAPGNRGGQWDVRSPEGSSAGDNFDRTPNYGGGVDGEFEMEAAGTYGMSSRETISAGDVHLRQGRYQAAIDFFTKEIEEKLGKDPSIAAKPIEKLVPFESQLNKLAQAYIAIGDFEQGKAMVELNRKTAAMKLKSEETFFRRVYADILGRLPTEEEFRDYSSDDGDDRRNRLIKSLTRKQEEAAAKNQAATLPAQMTLVGVVEEHTTTFTESSEAKIRVIRIEHAEFTPAAEVPPTQKE